MRSHLAAVIFLLLTAGFSNAGSERYLRPAKKSSPEVNSRDRLRIQLATVTQRLEEMNEAEWSRQIDSAVWHLKKTHRYEEARAIGALKSGGARGIALRQLKSKIDGMSSNGFFLLIDLLFWMDGDPLVFTDGEHPAGEVFLHLLFWVGTFDATPAQNF